MAGFSNSSFHAPEIIYLNYLQINVCSSVYPKMLCERVASSVGGAVRTSRCLLRNVYAYACDHQCFIPISRRHPPLVTPFSHFLAHISLISSAVNLHLFIPFHSRPAIFDLM